MGQHSWEREGLEHGEVEEGYEGAGGALCGQLDCGVTEDSPCPSPPAHLLPTYGSLSNSAAFPGPRGSPWGSSGRCVQAGPGLCSGFTSQHLLKDALRGSRCGASTGASWSKWRERANPDPYFQLRGGEWGSVAPAAQRRNC